MRYIIMDFSLSKAQDRTQDHTAPVYELRLKNHLDELEALSRWVSSLESQLDLSPKGAFQLELVLVEAVTNVIENGYPDEDVHEIVVTLCPAEGRVRAQIKDDGLPFNPLDQPQKVLPSSLDEAVEGGLGIHLIRSYAQGCAYKRLDNHNILTIDLAA